MTLQGLETVQTHATRILFTYVGLLVTTLAVILSRLGVERSRSVISEVLCADVRAVNQFL